MKINFNEAKICAVEHGSMTSLSLAKFSLWKKMFGLRSMTLTIWERKEKFPVYLFGIKPQEAVFQNIQMVGTRWIFQRFFSSNAGK